MSYFGASVNEAECNRARSPLGANLQVLLRECTSVAQAAETRGLLPGEIHAWHASPEMMELDREYASSLLSPDEHARMGRFRFEKDKDNFLFCRAVLRMLLASYLGAIPQELKFEYSAHGKPSLAGSSACLSFNLSHSHGDFLLATSLGRRVGVDLERVRHDLDVQQIARRFFSSAENEAIRTMPIASRYNAFFSCWTRKEAYVKAQGEGLFRPLDSFDVSVEPGDERVLLTTRPDPSEADRWVVMSLSSVPGFAVAIAMSCECASMSTESKRGLGFGATSRN